MQISLNPTIFRAYDIRGVVGSDLTPQIAELIGKAYGTYIQRIGGKEIASGRDNRLSSKELQDAFIIGVRSTGCNVIDIGISLSPMLYFTAANWKLSGGVNVTGSHNPVQYNGFKMTKEEAAPIAEEEILELKNIIETLAFEKGKGDLKQLSIKSDYFEFVKKGVTLSKRIKVVIDAGNGTAGIYAPELLREIGCEVVELFCDSDGKFPNHLPDPEIEENLLDLKREVVKQKADLGLAYDGDGDRIGLVDEKGDHYEADLLLILLARDFLRKFPGEKVVFDVKCSRNVYDDINNSGGIPIFSKTGHSLIKKRMRQEGILLGGELSGHMFFGEDSIVIDDALKASCRLLNILTKDERRLSDHFSGLRKYYSTQEIKVPCPDEDKFQVVNAVSEFFLLLYPDSITIDGIRINFPNGWALVRASNTNPYLTVRIEAMTKDGFEEIRRMVFGKLAEFTSVSLPSEMQKGG